MKFWVDQTKVNKIKGTTEQLWIQFLSSRWKEYEIEIETKKRFIFSFAFFLTSLPLNRLPEFRNIYLGNWTIHTKGQHPFLWISILDFSESCKLKNNKNIFFQPMLSFFYLPSFELLKQYFACNISDLLPHLTVYNWLFIKMSKPKKGIGTTRMFEIDC